MLNAWLGLVATKITIGWPYAVLGVVYAIVAYFAWRATRREADSQHDLVAFDLTVEYGVTALAFVLLSIVGMTDPTIVATVAVPDHTVMATGTVLAFAAIGIGRLAFVVLRRRGQRGAHPFQRSIAMAAAELGKSVPE